MPYDGRVYRILIGSPSDVDVEREIAARVIQEWNDLYSYSRKVVLLPLRWETHTAPEYGVRPQEVINRAIVDECDLLVGIFWARIGSPTGEADSGTLEEIERVGRAGKPIMLYFSKVGVDPDEMDLKQVEKLKLFKEKTYPNALTESYKSHIEFRDKFARQLELKVRELQRADSVGPPPLVFAFLDPGRGELVETRLSTRTELPVVKDVISFTKNVENSASARTIVDEAILQRVAVPVVLAIRNASSSGVRDVYVEIAIRAERTVQIAQSLTWGSRLITVSSALFGDEPSPLEQAVNKNVAQFEEQGLVTDGDGWKLSFEWGALQPQRVRLIKPVLFVVPRESTCVTFDARVLADGFAQPLKMTARLDIEVSPVETTVEQLVPNILKRLARSTPAGLSAQFKPVLYDVHLPR